MKFDIPIFQLKRMAKKRTREVRIPLHRALYEVARSQGFRDWEQLVFLERQERVAATLTRNLVEGDILLLGARPNQGKTQLALKLLVRAVKGGMPGYFFSLEYTMAQVWAQLKSYGLTQDNARNEITVDTSDTISASYISEQVGQLQRPAFIVVDYLQLLDQRRDNAALEDQVDELSHMASQTSSIIILLSQIDRKFNPDAEKVPGLKNIRLPNPFEFTHFTKTCFVHEGACRISNHP
jgi:replicative DNA helicase